MSNCPMALSSRYRPANHQGSRKHWKSSSSSEWRGAAVWSSPDHPACYSRTRAVQPPGAVVYLEKRPSRELKFKMRFKWLLLTSRKQQSFDKMLTLPASPSTEQSRPRQTYCCMAITTIREATQGRKKGEETGQKWRDSSCSSTYI